MSGVYVFCLYSVSVQCTHTVCKCESFPNNCISQHAISAWFILYNIQDLHRQECGLHVIPTGAQHKVETACDKRRQKMSQIAEVGSYSSKPLAQTFS